MDSESRKEIARLEARIKELETRLAISSMPEDVSALIDDLGLEVETREKEERLDIFMIEDFLKLLGYRTKTDPKLNFIIFTDMFKDYIIDLREDQSIRVSMYEFLDPDANGKLLDYLNTILDLGVDMKLSDDGSEVGFTVYSKPLDTESFRESVRFFIDLLNQKADKLFSSYNDYVARSIIKNTGYNARCS